MKSRLLLMALGCVFVAGNAVAGFSFSESAGKHTDIKFDDKIVARYMHAFDKSSPEALHETYKPYLHVYDADGIAPITKGSQEQFPHHRGIFVGWSKIKWEGERHDLWHMKGVYQVHQEYTWQEAGEEGAGLTSRVEWLAPDGKPLLNEERTMLFAKLPGDGLIGVAFITKLTAVRGDVLLDGDPEHAGVQYRPAADVDRAVTRYAFPKADADPKKDRDYPWVGSTHVLDDNTYSVVHINHPENPKDTIYSAYRDYGRFGAFFVKEIPDGETLTLKYAFLIKEGDMPAQSVIEAYASDFANKTYTGHALDAPGAKPWMTGEDAKK